MRKRSLRVASRILGAAGLTPLAVVFPSVLLGVALTMGNPPPERRLVESSNGEQAKLSYYSGFLGRDATEVTLKRPGCCRSTIVFRHLGPSEFSDPKLEWLDDRHLRITYHARPGDPEECKGQVIGVVITCSSSPWPDSPELTKP